MAKRFGPDDLTDLPADVTVSPPELLARSFIAFERYPLTLRSPGREPATYGRDMLRVGMVVAALPFDPVRDEVVLMRQFRLGSHLSTGRGEMIEIVAGLVERDEDTATAAARECLEEIGAAPSQVIELLTFMPAPGFTDEYATLYLAIVDADTVPERAGLDVEQEQTIPMRFSVDEAIAAISSGRLTNGYLLHALNWLALNRHRLKAIVANGSVRV